MPNLSRVKAAVAALRGKPVIANVALRPRS